MISREQLEAHTRFDSQGKPVAPRVFLCWRCGGGLHFCDDPYCWDIMHHDTHRCGNRKEEVDVRDLSAYLIFDPDTYEEALAEVQGYEEYTRFMYRYWGIK